MSVQSAIVLTVVLALAVFAIWRNIKKGAPCECGCDKGGCGCGCCGNQHAEKQPECK